MHFSDVSNEKRKVHRSLTYVTWLDRCVSEWPIQAIKSRTTTEVNKNRYDNRVDKTYLKKNSNITLSVFIPSWTPVLISSSLLTTKTKTTTMITRTQGSDITHLEWLSTGQSLSSRLNMRSFFNFHRHGDHQKHAASEQEWNEQLQHLLKSTQHDGDLWLRRDMDDHDAGPVGKVGALHGARVSMDTKQTVEFRVGSGWRNVNVSRTVHLYPATSIVGQGEDVDLSKAAGKGTWWRAVLLQHGRCVKMLCQIHNLADVHRSVEPRDRISSCAPYWAHKRHSITLTNSQFNAIWRFKLSFPNDWVSEDKGGIRIDKLRNWACLWLIYDRFCVDNKYLGLI